MGPPPTGNTRPQECGGLPTLRLAAGVGVAQGGQSCRRYVRRCAAAMAATALPALPCSLGPSLRPESTNKAVTPPGRKSQAGARPGGRVVCEPSRAEPSGPERRGGEGINRGRPANADSDWPGVRFTPGPPFFTPGLNYLHQAGSLIAIRPPCPPTWRPPWRPPAATPAP